MQERIARLVQDPRFQRLGRFVQHRYFVIIVAGVMASLAFLMLVSFVVLDWYSLQIEIEGIAVVDESRTGVGVMLGTGENSPFGRVIDILLVLVPLSSITLIVLAALAITKRLPLSFALSSASVIALLMLMLPLIWQGLSTNDIKSEGDSNQEAIDFFTDGYSTEEQSIFGFLLLLLTSTALALHIANQFGLFSASEESELVFEDDLEGGRKA